MTWPGAAKNRTCQLHRAQVPHDDQCNHVHQHLEQDSERNGPCQLGLEHDLPPRRLAQHTRASCALRISWRTNFRHFSGKRATLGTAPVT